MAEEAYWADYNSLQHAKHELLTSYLNAWFPILSAYNGRVLYIDSHAGRGRHDTGHSGSPIRALEILRNHSARQKILSRTECQFVFFENNSTNAAMLQEEVKALGDLPKGIEVSVYSDDFESVLSEELDLLSKNHQQLAPAFAFIDPYSFSLPMDLLNKLLQFSKCELLVNLMIRFADLAVTGSADNSYHLNRLYGTDEWVNLRSIPDQDSRFDEAINLFSHQLNAKYVTHLHMKGMNGKSKYVLIHATNNRMGKEKIKEAMWKVKPDGIFSVYERHNPAQLVLITPEPDLELLRIDLLENFANKTVRMNQLYEWLIDTLYLKKHLHKVLRELKDAGRVAFSEYEGRFAFRNNPLVKFSP